MKIYLKSGKVLSITQPMAFALTDKVLAGYDSANSPTEVRLVVNLDELVFASNTGEVAPYGER